MSLAKLLSSLSAIPILCVSLTAQSPKPQLTFEVASVKVNKSIDSQNAQQVMRNMTLQYFPGGRLSARGVPVSWLIFEAYNVSPAGGRISMNPDFARSLDRSLASEIYDIDAVAGTGVIPAGISARGRNDLMRQMLQSLLADRFKLVVRREMKEVPAYVIGVGKNGPQLQKSTVAETDCIASTDRADNGRFFGGADPNGCHTLIGSQGQGFRGKAVDVADLARAIEGFSDRPIVDQTGLKGLYQIDIPGWVPLRSAVPRPSGSESSAEELAAEDPGRPTIFNLLEKLGLKLESQKAIVEILVIEHFEKPLLNH